MTPDVWLLLTAAVVLLLVAWVTWTLTRLGRLEARVERAWTALETQLTRRAELAEELARDHATAVGEERAARLRACVREVRAPRTGDRELAENALGRELRDLPADLPGVPSGVRADLAGTAIRIGLARRFYNDAVRDTSALRTRRLPVLLRLHASRPVPRFFDIEDDLREVTGSAAGGGRARP
ncbi:hypothetical protein [Geodermatophilus poikilotrophus]|uniref:Uncharacterized conserved protein n=1 Tax=Geodermatophilus poikilotrophus TaxID=1333667 RepID=A0A1I0B1F7_9ACTN|nr:hypothetical protein [Geodermatophilus poikilotrophus]SET00557.1 Uncharacterized conserved protein [Geodermatophilus poikilotrophus]